MDAGSDTSAYCKTEVAGVTAAGTVANRTDDTRSSTPPPHRHSSLKRPATVGTGASPPAKRSARVEDWSVDDVLSCIRILSLEHVQDKFRDNAVDGLMLLEVSEEELRNELGLTLLQARKVKASFPN